MKIFDVFLMTLWLLIGLVIMMTGLMLAVMPRAVEDFLGVWTLLKLLTLSYSFSGFAGICLIFVSKRWTIKLIAFIFGAIFLSAGVAFRFMPIEVMSWAYQTPGSMLLIASGLVVGSLAVLKLGHELQPTPPEPAT